MKCLDELASLHPKPNFVVASGSLPPGVPEDFFRTRCEERQDELREEGTLGDEAAAGMDSYSSAIFTGERSR